MPIKAIATNFLLNRIFSYIPQQNPYFSDAIKMIYDRKTPDTCYQ